MAKIRAEGQFFTKLNIILARSPGPAEDSGRGLTGSRGCGGSGGVGALGRSCASGSPRLGRLGVAAHPAEDGDDEDPLLGLLGSGFKAGPRTRAALGPPPLPPAWASLPGTSPPPPAGSPLLPRPRTCSPRFLPAHFPSGPLPSWHRLEASSSRDPFRGLLAHRPLSLSPGPRLSRSWDPSLERLPGPCLLPSPRPSSGLVPGPGFAQVHPASPALPGSSGRRTCGVPSPSSTRPQPARTLLLPSGHSHLALLGCPGRWELQPRLPPQRPIAMRLTSPLAAQPPDRNSGSPGSWESPNTRTPPRAFLSGLNDVPAPVRRAGGAGVRVARAPHRPREQPGGARASSPQGPPFPRYKPGALTSSQAPREAEGTGGRLVHREGLDRFLSPRAPSPSPALCKGEAQPRLPEDPKPPPSPRRRVSQPHPRPINASSAILRQQLAQGLPGWLHPKHLQSWGTGG
nr:proline-rich protein 2-like [Cavia porcellus]